jgi:hypothetical protein
MLLWPRLSGCRAQMGYGDCLDVLATLFEAMRSGNC